MAVTRPGVVMITGAYHPESTGASRQCRQLVASLQNRALFRVVTTTTDASLPADDVVDAVPVRRVYVDPASPLSKMAAVVRTTRALLRVRRDIDIVHLHGFSQKSMLVIALAKVLRLKIVIKLTSFGHDDAIAMRRRPWVFAFYARADAFIGVSPRFLDAHRAARLPEARFRFVPNGVDLTRFRPVSERERALQRQALGLPLGGPLVLFVGFFSAEKRPDVLYAAWRRLAADGLVATLVFVGATRGRYHEIDPEMAGRIRADAGARGLSSRIAFVEATETIEAYYQAADVFALPTTREGLPNVLLEAMACGVPPVITRLAGVTDWIVKDGVHGQLVDGESEEALAAALRRVLDDPERRRAMGRAGRQHIEANFGAAVAADRTLDVYRELVGGTAPERAHA